MTVEREAREFPTLVIATAVSGVALCNTTYSEIKIAAAWLFGGDLWTHELAHGPTMDMVVSEAEEQFPQLPTRAEAMADWKAACNKAIDAYGAIISVRRGAGKRRESPVDTLKAVAPHADIIKIEVRRPKGKT